MNSHHAHALWLDGKDAAATTRRFFRDVLAEHHPDHRADPIGPVECVAHDTFTEWPCNAAADVLMRLGIDPKETR